MDGECKYVVTTDGQGRGFVRWQLSIPDHPTCGIRVGRAYFRKGRSVLWPLVRKPVWRKVAGYLLGEIRGDVQRLLSAA